nr:long-chain-fatty-acid--CoA ligase [Roseateles sp. XES5]
MASEITPLGHPSIGALVESSCAQFADRPAFTSMGKTLTFRDFDAASRALAAYFQSLGLERGDRVALMMPNVMQYPVAVAAVLRAGLVVVNVNPLYTPRELEHQLKDAGAKAIVILENFAATLQQCIANTPVKHVLLASMGEMLGFPKGLIVNYVVRKVKKLVPAFELPGHIAFKQVMAEGARGTVKPTAIVPSDTAFLQYTGGTTGVSKGATLTHSNLLSNMEQIKLWIEPTFRIKKRPDQLTFVCALPLYHIFALTVNGLAGIALGGHNVLIANPRDIPAFVKELAKIRTHIFPGLNTLFNALMNNPDFAKLDFSELVLTLGGGMAVQQATAEKWLKITGCPVVEGYGLSETSPVATVNRVDVHDFTGSIGLPVPNTEIAIRDDDGRDMPLGERGEICIRGPQVMAGYWNRPDETAKVMYEDGFFKSGDIGVMDEQGYVRIVDRKKDMILVSGFNVYPNEVEQVVNLHPGVLECAAVGVPDARSGEAVKLYVVKKDPALDEAQVRAFCEANLTGYKRPKIVEFRTELPKTPVGKILRKDLRG